MIELTELEKLVLAFIGSSSLLILAGLAVDDRLRRRAHNHGWARAASRLAERVTRQREAHDELRNYAVQLASHVGDLAADNERMRSELAQVLTLVRPLAARRPPSDDTDTVRLGVAPGRTERLSRLDPSWPASNGSRP